jgi:hypothetical protein
MMGLWAVEEAVDQEIGREAYELAGRSRAFLTMIGSSRGLDGGRFLTVYFVMEA